MSYPGTNIFLICYSLTEKSTLANVEYKWRPELLKHQMNDIPFILVGTKSDIADSVDPSKRVKPDEIKSLVERIKPPAVLECSAKTQHNLRNVFETAIHVVIRPQDFGLPPRSTTGIHNAPRQEEKGCCLLC